MGQTRRVGAPVAGKGGLSALDVLLGFGPRLLLEILWAVLRGKRRSLAADAARVIALMDAPPRVEGQHLVPARGPFLLVANHFQVPGVWVGWVALAIANAVAGARAPGSHELHWMVLSEWRWFEAWGRWVPNPISSLLFARAGKVWGTIATPSRPSDTAGRARALRQVLTYLGHGRRGGPAEPVALFPEGTATVGLGEAKPGTGAFLARVSRLGVPMLPVGVCQEDGALVVRFGPPFFVDTPTADGAEGPDSHVRRQVMLAIGRLLPARLWGTYAEAIAAAERGLP